MTFAVGWAIVIALLMLLRAPAEMSVVKIPGMDKLGHGVVFAVLGFMCAGAFRKEYRNKTLFIMIFLCCSLYGIVLESMQSFGFTKRHFDFFDIIANIIGSSVGVLLFIAKFKSYD